MNTFKTLALLVALAPTAQALDLGHDVKLSGFGTVGSVSSTTSGADFVSNHYYQDDGAGRSAGTSVVVDSKLGLQLDWQATDRLSFTTQAISKQRGNADWSPELEMAFAKYNLMPNLAVRAGRIRPAIYMLSDYLDVNYANPWIRPPSEFYSTLTVSRMEGVDLLWRPRTGPVTWLVQPYYGSSSESLRLNGKAGFDDIYGLNLTGSWGDFSVRAGYLHSQLTAYLPIYEQQVSPNLRKLCTFPVAAVRDAVACQQLSELDVTNKNLAFGSLGATWDNGDYFVSGEVGKRNSNSLFADATTWYVTGGKRFDKLTPYVTYSSFTNDSPTKFTSGKANTNLLVTNTILVNQMDQATFTLGMRYDVISNVALKFQWDRIDTYSKNGQAGTAGGLFVNRGPSFLTGDNHAIDLFSISADFVF